MKNLLLFLLACSLGAAAAARPIRGSVKCGGKPMGGVTVTDGYTFAQSDEQGIFTLDADAWDVAAQITAAGSVFIGPWSPESAGDYASGTNHTLPTGGWARAYSGVNTDSFLRKITYQELSRKGLAALSPTVIAMAEAEGLGAHAAAVRVRMKGGVL